MNPYALIALIGLVLGLVVFFISPGKIRGGLILTMVVGAVAAVAMSLLGQQVGLAMPGQTAGFFTAVIGTGLVLAIWRAVMGSAEQS